MQPASPLISCSPNRLTQNHDFKSNGLGDFLALPSSSMNRPAGYNRDEHSGSSQFQNYVPLHKECPRSPNISVHDFRLRPEIVSQFNYYKIISEFKREQEVSNQKSNSKIGGNRHQWQRSHMMDGPLGLKN